ncbi:MAG: RND transporter [Planctomycetota bacterium]|jgi:hypothetical protein
MLTKTRWTVSLALLGMITFVAGCTGGGDATSDSGTDTTPVAQTDDHADHEGHEEGAENKHGGWWCVEHGVPEGECTRCDASLTASFKDKGDWCDEHDLPESQCFKCDPKRAEPFIARYEAKYGKKPPAPTE